MTADTPRRASPGARRAGRVRVAIYSHDTFGLGHLTRSCRIARGAVAAYPDGSVLLLSGSPIAHRFSFPPAVDYIKLPSVVKSGPNTYDARELRISRRRIRQMRSQLILDALDAFNPHLLLVDNVPTGMKGELLPTLEWLHRRSRRTRVHLNLRDVLDNPEVIRSAWESQGIPTLLRSHFDEIDVFGDPAVYDAVAAYDLPPERTHYMSYIAPTETECHLTAPLQPVSGERARVLVTSGGGGDGADVLFTCAQLQHQLGESSPFHFDLVTGPLMDPALRAKMHDAGGNAPHLRVYEYVDCLPAWMAAADLVLSMGGYNTLCEVLAVARRSLVVPRVYPRREQQIRARALAARGLVSVLEPDALAPEGLSTALLTALRAPPTLPANGRVPMRGIPKLVARLRALRADILSPARSLPRRPSRSRPKPARATSPPPPTLRSPGQAEEPPARRRPHSRRATMRALRRAVLRRLPPTGPLLILFLAAGLTTVAACPARADDSAWLPVRASASSGFGYDSNLLDASDAEREAFDSQAPDAFFVVGRMEDAYWEGKLEADWKPERIAGVKTKVRGSLEHTRYFHNPIRNSTRYALQLQVRLTGAAGLELEGAYTPQIYGRHRRDKDALPGEPLFRPDVHRRWDAEVALERELGDHWELRLAGEGSWRTYEEAFRERDRTRWGAFGEAVWEPGTGWEVATELGWRRNRSRNEPDLGKDLSCREWLIEPTVRWDLGLRRGTLTLGGGLAWRDYTAGDPADWNHYGRTDRHEELILAYEQLLTATVTFEIVYAARWRRAELASGESIDYDEEGSFSEHTLLGAFSWEWERRED